MKRTEYYQSKELRVAKLVHSGIAPRDIVLDILSVTLPMTTAQPIQGVVGQLATQLDYDDLFDGVKTASELIAIVCFSDLYDIIPARDSDTGSLMLKSNFTLEEETLQKLSNFKYLPPMLCKPMTVASNNHSGYLTKEDSVILGKDNHHSRKQALDVINTCNGIALSLDKGMLRFKEKSKKPLDTQEQLDAHNRLCISSNIVYKELLANDNKFYFNWKYDKRGRSYSQGYHVNIQSTSYKKAIINLHEKHLITGA